MKKLLTIEEHFENCRNEYVETENGLAFETVGKPRGTMKQVRFPFTSTHEFRIVYKTLQVLGLLDYINVDYEEEIMMITFCEEE